MYHYITPEIPPKNSPYLNPYDQNVWSSLKQKGLHGGNVQDVEDPKSWSEKSWRNFIEEEMNDAVDKFSPWLRNGRTRWNEIWTVNVNLQWYFINDYSIKMFKNNIL